MGRFCDVVDFLKKQRVSAVKIQHLYCREILHPKLTLATIGGREVDLAKHFKKSETSLENLKKMKSYCDERGLLFMSSFFGEESFANLKKISASCYKIASPESNFLKLWKLLIKEREPIFFSTGVTRNEDLIFLFQFFKKNEISKKRLVLLQCVSAYPTPVEEYNLSSLYRLRLEHGVQVGISDHSDDPYIVPSIAVILTAMFEKTFIIEKHFVDERQGEIDDRVSLDKNELQDLLVKLRYQASWARENKAFLQREYADFLLSGDYGFLIRLENQLKIEREKIKKILGDGFKKLAKSEEANYLTTNRSLLSIKDIAKDECLSEENSAFLRSEKRTSVGLNYEWEEKINALKAREFIPNGSPVTTENTIITH